MVLHYGADSLVTAPIYGAGNPTNDYGLGFYLTPDKKMARLWASKFPQGGYAISFKVALEGLKVLYLNSNTQEDILRWITILVSHRFDADDYEQHRQAIDWLKRRYYPDVSGYDVIVGYRADDSYFGYSKSFVANDLSIEKLSEAMKLGKLGLQYVLVSKKAFSKARYASHEAVPHSSEYEAFREGVLEQYRIIKSQDKDTNTFLRDIRRQYPDD